MPFWSRGDVWIRYEEHGRGFPVLLLAPGGLRSAIDTWPRAPVDPLAHLAGDFRLVAMDQRNAGVSTGPLVSPDPWRAYADDQLGLLDELGIDRCLLIGCCIGCSYALALCERAPDRIAAAVLEQPIGVSDANRGLFLETFRSWGAELLAARPGITEDDLARFGAGMWDGDFVASVSREAVARCRTPLLVLPGTDDFHPRATGLEVAALAPGAVLVDPWRDTDEQRAAAAERIREFLQGHAA